MDKCRKMNVKRVLSLLLALSLLLSNNGITVFAGANGANQATADENQTKETPANPEHHCTNGESTEWSYVYFGSYPQTEITDSSTIASIEGVISASGSSVAGEGVDAEVTEADGTKTKYRRIGKGDASDNRFTKNEYRYFKYEPIRWKVLWNDGNTLFVAAEKALDYKKYHDTLTDVTWETCTLRTWLNDFFYRTAFSADEQKAIVPQDVTNEDHPDPKYGTEGGNDTRDHIYLLSMEEVTDEFYGFCRESSDTEIRVVKETDFSYVRGTHGMGKGDASWRLRPQVFTATMLHMWTPMEWWMGMGKMFPGSMKAPSVRFYI